MAETGPLNFAIFAGKYPISEVLVLTLITAFLGFHLRYTRISGSALIALLFKQCGPEDQNDLCDYNRSVTLPVQLSISIGILVRGVQASL